MKTIPRGPENLICPLHRKAMAKVCHTCPMWMAIKGKHPQTGEDLDDWNCALVWGPIIAVQQTKEAHTVSRELNIMRNENATHHAEQKTMAAIAVQRSNDTFRDAVASYALPSNPVSASQKLIEAAE